MANYALINAGVVVDSITCDSTFASTISSFYQYVVDISGASPVPKINDTYDGANFTVDGTRLPAPVVTSYTGQQYFITNTLTDASTVSWNMNTGQSARVTLGGNRTLSASNFIQGSTYTLSVVQDGTGNRTLAYDTMFKWPVGSAFVLSSAANAVDVLTFLCDNGSLLGMGVKNFS